MVQFYQICLLPQRYITKKETHYLKKFEINGNIGDYPDIERYINENYKELSVNQIKQGYLTHLIEDQLWFSKYIPKLATKKRK